jgi:hypothetical protein
MIQQVELAEREGCPVHTIFEGCVLRPQLLSSVEGVGVRSVLGRAQAFRRAASGLVRSRSQHDRPWSLKGWGRAKDERLIYCLDGESHQAAPP